MNSGSSALAAKPVTSLKGVGPALATKLEKLGISSVGQLLFHLPNRYLDRTRIQAIGSLQPASSAVVEAEVRVCDVVYGRRRTLVCKIQDHSGILTLRFFHFTAAQKQRLVPGAQIRCFGELRRGATSLEMVHPEYELVDQNSPKPLAQYLTPNYPATEGLTQPRLRVLIEQALEQLEQQPIAELLPAQITQALGQIPLAQALQLLHKPPVGTDLQAITEGTHPYQQRLIFEELLAHQLSMLMFRNRAKQARAQPLGNGGELAQKFQQSLPFSFTKAQRRVVEELNSDLAQSEPMLRLVQGDVGSGKTVVAAMAALCAVASGQQAAVMAPTEILAEQHYANFSQWLGPLGVTVAYLSGRQKTAARREALQLAASGAAQVVIGTHALFQENVQFNQLALAIIDEQHRFGVHQRLALSSKAPDGLTPHQLIMTATPIPRTLAMSAYADLDCSVIDELPPGRTPIATVVIADTRRDEVIERVNRACSEGRQAYWVCTLIEESEAMEAQAAEATCELLQSLLPSLKIALVHGRMKAAEKDAVMQAFKAGDTDLLVATTVIEVGVDVPNASLMIIENPERLGLSQLHQLRGRVGRGAAASHCVLLYGSPLSNHSKERLRVMRESSDGFYIAEQDLELRGPGEVLGTRQTGEMQFRIAQLTRDSYLLPDVRKAAEYMLAHHHAKAQAVLARWLSGREKYLGA
ncbi:ATP-dependent DNA helicase RecG [Gilvimarinus sp. SDUM040013]|uniref:ATP-dependent DNA helicase RecG n=1 Tax=Gilvimarinus gilvus TaxID=3058038 RepID=A0ABU4RXA6_9GAMM|nr:ATP-dependent DNA helicase RecG [Gilvimarinus sp. SDUM040013]MDO3388627.1 ATP-dependent DNA helicase RecG [Gilvimarinus sp. SDUM040013]MDX6849522.1 ATP-dependent DNA helicase RecG [Gilvimarinus sp. SDUM040013]